MPKPDDGAADLLRSLRSEKDNTIARRRKIDEEIAAINHDVMKKVSEKAVWPDDDDDMPQHVLQHLVLNH